VQNPTTSIKSAKGVLSSAIGCLDRWNTISISVETPADLVDRGAYFLEEEFKTFRPPREIFLFGTGHLHLLSGSAATEAVGTF